MNAANAESDASSSARWTVDDLLTVELADDWTLSSDGTFAIWTQQVTERVEGEQKRVSNLWLSRLDSGKAIPLTRGQDRAGSPHIAPDGKHVAFSFNRKIPGADKEIAGSQVWILPLDGGEAWPLTRFEHGGPRAFQWIDAKTLAVAAPETPTAVTQQRKKNKDRAVVVDDFPQTPPVRLFRVPLEGPTRRLTSNDDWIDSLAVSPDGKRAVVTAQQDLSYNFDQEDEPLTYLVDLESGELQQILPGRKLLPFRISWAPDSRSFYFLNEHTNHPTLRMATISELYRYSLDGEHGEPESAQPVYLDWPRGASGDFTPTANGLVLLLEDGVHRRPALLQATDDGTWSRTPLTGGCLDSVDDLLASRDGSRLLYRCSTSVSLPQWFTARLDGATAEGELKLTELNAGLEAKNTGRREILHWTGANGDQVEGILLFPLDWPADLSFQQVVDGAKVPGGPRPLLLDIHGGPAAADRDAWDQRWSGPQLLYRQRGAFILQVNYHGSAAYGLDWVESIAERYYEQETVDIESGVDHVLEAGLADPQRLGIYGWSNGGILTTEIITRTDRYRAASVGAADVEWISDWANVDFGAAFDNYYFGGTPWERRDHYIEKSPFFRLEAVTTPTIIYTGTDDRAVPPHQSWSLFRGLQHFDNAPVRLVLFPDEGHGLRHIPHQRRKVEEDLAWFDRYLFEQSPNYPAAIKEGSPAHHALARAAAARDGEGQLGTEVDGTLVPETVTLDGREVGRFEVTRNQWASYRAATGGESLASGGNGELPITAVSFEEAQAYAAWLQELTGRPFRLPTVAEAKKLAGKPGGGNTLNHWAGYSPSPEEATALRQALGVLPGNTPLLRPVGQFSGFSGTGEAAVFDLDGNAAEWAVTEDKSGKAVGPSCDQSGDSYRGTATSDPSYIGLRVVVGPWPESEDSKPKS
ncbi:MAG: prolyl oligopeptidase family serine peptidase [Acidobacteriota bacterium]